MDELAKAILVFVAVIGGVYGFTNGSLFRKGLSEAYTMLSDAVDSMSKDLQRKDNENTVLRTRLDNLDEKYSRLKVDFEKLNDEQNHMRDSVSDLTREKNVLEDQVKSGQVKQTELVTQLEKLKQEYTSLQQKYDELETLYKKLADGSTDTIQELTAKLEKVKHFLTACGLGIEQLEKIIMGELKEGYIYERTNPAPSGNTTPQP